MALNQPKLRDWLAWGKETKANVPKACKSLKDWLKDGQEAFEERAAIMQYEGGLSRLEAEQLAKQNTH